MPLRLGLLFFFASFALSLELAAFVHGLRMLKRAGRGMMFSLIASATN
jgi:hypothetical protein